VLYTETVDDWVKNELVVKEELEKKTQMLTYCKAHLLALYQQNEDLKDQNSEEKEDRKNNLIMPSKKRKYNK
jgi:BMFP domain-containing protein YqiC